MKSLEQLKLENIKHTLELRLKTFTKMVDTKDYTTEYGHGMLKGRIAEINRILELFDLDQNN